MSHDHDLVYFWASVLTAGIPVAAFVVIAWLVTKAYFKRREEDGGGPAPER
jgi:hypothetical protein